MPGTECEWGSEQQEKVLCPMPELMISSERWLMNYLRVHAGGITLELGCAGESGFDPVELWVMGPPCGLKVGKE